MITKSGSGFAGLIMGAILLMGCGATQLVSTPIENIDRIPLKVAELTEEEKKTWGHADLLTDTIPGMSVDKAYKEIIGNRKGKTVIVAVLDSGIDLNHEDLDGVLWTNIDEKPGNGKDDDGNGYIDDVHGYNFLGTSYNEQLEYARIVRLGIGSDEYQAKARAMVDSEYPEMLQNKQRYEQILQVVKSSDEAIKKHLGKDTYTKNDVNEIKTDDQTLAQQVSVIQQMYAYAESIPDVMEELNEGIKYFSEHVNYYLNVDFNGREEVGDNPYELNDVGYGNGNPMNKVPTEDHGTHVAGIIAAERNNGLGVDGVANNVQIMSVRAVPNGDEYDKDIALGIRYAVDNGAQIINCSFGKSFSPNPEWVYDALKYAASKDVLIVHAAGNDGLDLDSPENPNFPNDQIGTDPEMVDNVITVGSLDSSYGSEMVSGFSNYGKSNVDVFAPGGAIYSTVPGSTYKFMGGTSMAAPGVSGIAALIRSYYPKLTAPEVKKILIDSGLSTTASVVVAGDSENTKPFNAISKSGKMVNAFNALILANKVAQGKIKLAK